MECLTPTEVSRWLCAHSLVEDPAHADVDNPPPHGFEFYAPTTYYGLECFVDAVLNEVVGHHTVLLVATDCNPSSRSRDFIIDGLRRSIGEARLDVDAPGYVVPANELEKAVGLFSLMSGFRWKCYLYCGDAQLTMYNWSGSIFEVWAPSLQRVEHVRTIVRNFDLKELPTDV